MRLARLAALLAALTLSAVAASAADRPPFAWDGLWAGIGASAASTDLSLPGPQPFFAGSGLTGADSATARGGSLDLSVTRLWQRPGLVLGLEAGASSGGVSFTDPWPSRILADLSLFPTICSDCAHLLVNGKVTSTASLRGLLGTVRPDGTLWFASLGLTRGSAALTALGSFESRPPLLAGILHFGQIDLPLRGATFGIGIARPLGTRSALRIEVLQDRFTASLPDTLTSALGPDLHIRSTRLALSYQLRF